MSASKLQRPPDDAYYVEPWSDTFLQGDLFRDVPVAIPAPPDAVVMAEGERRFVSGPFDAGAAMLISPSCAIAAQGPNVPPDPTRTPRARWFRSGPSTSSSPPARSPSTTSGTCVPIASLTTSTCLP